MKIYAINKCKSLLSANLKIWFFIWLLLLSSSCQKNDLPSTRSIIDKHNVRELVEVTTLRTNQDMPVAAMVIPPMNEDLFLSQAGSEGNIQQWSIPDQKCLNQMNIGPVSLTGTAFSADGQFLAVTAGKTKLADEAGYSTTLPGVRVAETQTGAVKAEFGVEHIDPLLSGVALDTTGHWLITGDRGGMNIWDTVEKRSRYGTVQGQRATAIAFSQDDSRAAVAFDDSGIDIYQLNYQMNPSSVDVDRLLMLNHQTGAALAVQFSPDNQSLAVLSHRNLVFIDSLAEIEKIIAGDYDKPSLKDPAEMTREEAQDAHWAKLFARLDMIEQHQIIKPVPSGSAGALAFNPAGDLLAVGTAGGWQIWNVKRQELLLERETDGVYALTFSPDGRWFAWGDANGTVHLWAVLGKPD
jgi:WD40 repeat protein